MNTWDDSYLLLKEYKEEHGDCLVPRGYVVDGFNLYNWCCRMRYVLRDADTDDKLYKIRLLNNLGFSWNTLELRWDKAYALLKEYKEEHGVTIVPYNYTIDGVNLYSWCKKQRLNYGKNKLRKDREKLLKELGFAFNTSEYNWEEKYISLKRFVFYRDRLPKTNDLYNKVWIGKWLRYQIDNKEKLSNDKIEKLRYLGVEI